MDWFWTSLLPRTPIILLPLSILLLLLLPVILFLHYNNRKWSKNLPPGPRGWPVFGNMFSLGTLSYVAMAKMKDKYGPVVWLRIGSIDTMVVLTADAAAELFKNHDLSFADRTVVDTMTSHDYHKSTLGFSPYGNYWRALRRLCSTEMFAVSKINGTVPVRRKCVDDLLSWVEIERGAGIHIAKFVFLAVFNILGNSMLSLDLVDPRSELGAEFYKSVMGFLHWCSCPNVSDLFPWLRPFDLQGLKRNMDRDMGKALEIASQFVRERIKEREQHGNDKRRGDFLDVLLEFEGRGGDEPPKFSELNISAFIMELFLVGGEATTTTIEWALAELLRNPEKLMKVKAEIHEVVGRNRRFEESDIENVPYLQAVVKESMRLHPIGPLLAPRRAIKDTKFMGYDIPRKTQVLVNAWAIGRDAESWEDPLSFTPERFLEGSKSSNTDYRGKHYELIPFGAGRRICAGLPMAHRTVHLFLGSLLHEFNWKLEDSVMGSTIDMTEKMGLAVRKLEPLKVIATKRLL